MAGEVKKILVATDFSAYATRTQHAAGSLCEESEFRITLLYVLDTSTFLFPENRLTPNLLPELVKVASINLKKQAKLLSNRYGIPVDFQVACGNPAQEILKIIEHDHTDMVITAIDENQSSESPHKVIARRIAAKTNCPVLTLYSTRASGPFGMTNVIRKKIGLFERNSKS
ncbi:MAG TPA: universal stress protein [Ohtaekwangia sp.]|jgi:nucleotide-binding universal stress UspA family protein